jgi:hypothetical protein
MQRHDIRVGAGNLAAIVLRCHYSSHSIQVDRAIDWPPLDFLRGKASLTMKSLSLAFCFLCLISVASLSGAFALRQKNGAPCTKDLGCEIRCDNGDLADVAYWNGSKWSTGVDSDESIYELAKRRVRA